MATVDVQRLAGTIGIINGYNVVVLGDAVAVFRGEDEIASEQVAGLGRFVASARELRTGWAEFEAANPDLLVWKPSILGRYYSKELLASDLARRTFLMPDLI